MYEISLSQIRVIIADDHQYFREGFISLIQKHADNYISVVGSASDGKELIQLVNSVSADVIITDIKMPEMDGIEATKHLNKSHPNIPVLGLSSFNEDHLIFEMYEAGAKGYMLKTISVTELVRAIKAVYNGEMYFDSCTSKSIIKILSTNRYNNSVLNNCLFTEKELVYIKLLCSGLSYKEIAGKMKLSHRSIEEYHKKVKEKTCSKNNIDIALYAVKNNLVSID
jgi:DNA-binding NarL/FixJ family response regulator